MSLKKEIVGITRLGREVKVSPKTEVIVKEPGHEIKYKKRSVIAKVQVVGAGEIVLSMEESVWNAINLGAEIKVKTIKKYRN